MARLISLCAGVHPELADDPVAFVDAAAAAGWPACGLWFNPATWTSQTTQVVRSRLDHHGIVALDMEPIFIGRDHDDALRLVDTAAELGVPNILTVSIMPDPTEAMQRYHQLCERAAPAGIRVCLEFSRIMALQTLEDTVGWIDEVQQPNSGILVDLLHLIRSGGTVEDLAAVDPGLFPYVQWCDGPAAPADPSPAGLRTDAVDDRSNVGEGDLPVREFINAFPVDTPAAMEIRSRDLRERYPDPVERAAVVLRATRSLLDS